ncbi:hypothetical protein H0I23_04110 [Cellulophaga sp. HaHaR_3_176]|uniref:hypothetical protein n=1 Tax=Cellulophaga sp. HaHaR_3_176 TaxID=1942464 RepID=UPI001C1F48D6|nr:hypothetical protein [Cellulophaga sp. HaHaR_3_176]QWX84834.1 hypothetical protein H0I23_04110 [Cellulophaga sp. HaHaR_3_176]
MNIENIQNQLAVQISNHNKTWGNLLANTNFGNEASSYWTVALQPTNISVDIITNSFTFKKAEFLFDVNVGVSSGDDIRLFTKKVSGKGSYQFTDDKTIHLTELKIEE